MLTTPSTIGDGPATQPEQVPANRDATPKNETDNGNASSFRVPRSDFRVSFSESKSESILYSLLAAILLVGFYFAMLHYWAPAHPGVDQNGYLVGGKLLAKNLSMKLTVPDVYSFVGRMWVGFDLGSAAERYYPKYPVGLPLLYAIALWVGGSHGVELAYKISPICTVLAIAGSYRLMRLFLPSFYSLLGMILVAISPVTLILTNNPNSHASCMACVVWGMFLLISWWRNSDPNEPHNGEIWRAMGAGFLLGVATTIRYSEGLLVLPIVVVVLLSFKREKKFLLQSFLMLASWFFPVMLLVAFNYFSFGSFTGYGPTNESTGFRWEYFQTNWETMVRQLYTMGLFFVFPFAVMGLIVMFAANWRLAIILAAWIVPCIIAYTAYYWAPDNISVAYVRFYLTIIPALSLCAVWLFRHVVTSSVHAKTVTIGVGSIIAIGAGFSLFTSLPTIEAEHRTNLSLTNVTEHATKSLPADAVVFTDERSVNHLQFVGDWRLYSIDIFNKRSDRRFSDRMDTDDPTPFQAQRAKLLYTKLKDFDENDLTREQNQLVTASLQAGRRVFLVMQKNSADQTKKRFLPSKVFTTTLLDSWDEPADLRPQKNRQGLGGFRPARGGNPGGPGGPPPGAGPGGPPPGGPGGPGPNPSGPPIKWNILEIKLAPPAPATKPATKPTTNLAVKPTTRSATKPSSQLSTTRPSL